MPDQQHTPDLPDREAEIVTNDDGTKRIRRLLHDGSTMHAGTQMETLRTWFVGPDGLTTIERDYAALVAAAKRVYPAWQSHDEQLIAEVALELREALNEGGDA